MRLHLKKYSEQKTKLQQFVLGSVILCTIVLLAARVLLANSHVDDRQGLARMQDQLALLGSENQTLEEYIRNNSSLAVISSRAEALGFSPKKDYQFLPKTENIVLRLWR